MVKAAPSKIKTLPRDVDLVVPSCVYLNVFTQILVSKLS